MPTWPLKIQLSLLLFFTVKHNSRDRIFFPVITLIPYKQANFIRTNAWNKFE